MKYNLENLTKWCVRMMWLSFGLGVLNIAHSMSYYALVDGDFGTSLSDSDYSSYATIVDLLGLVAIGYLVTLVASYVLNLIWIYRASFNAGQIQPDSERISPKAAVLWNFVPLANLFLPFRAIKQIWNSSEDPSGDLDRPAPPFFAIWWAFWIICNILDRISFQIAKRNDWNETPTTIGLDTTTTILGLVGMILFIRILHQVTSLQSARGDATIFE